MASEKTPPKARRPWLAISLLTLAALILCAALGIVWMLATESGTRALLSLLGRSPQVEMSDVRGTLVDDISIGKLVLHAGQSTLRIEGARMRWQPSQLRSGLLAIERMSARSLVIETRQGDDQPPQLPATLALPFKLSLGSLRVDRLDLTRDGKLLLRAADVALSLHYDGSRHRLQLQQMRVLPEGAAAIDGKLSGMLMLAATPPFDLDAQWRLDGSHAQGRANGSLRIDGTLQRLRAQLALQVARDDARARLDGTVSLRPFDAQVFAGAQLRASRLDLSTLLASLPRTRIDAQVAMQTPERGRFTLTNAMPGAISASRLPVASASGEFAMSSDALRLSSLTINGGEFSGDVSMRQRVRWSVHGRVRQLSLSRWHRSPALPDIVLGGRIDADAMLKPALRGRLSFTLDGTRVAHHPVSGHGELALSDSALAIRELALQMGRNRVDAQGILDRAGGKLQFALHAPALAQLGADISGSAEASGEFSGSFAQPALAIRWHVSELRMPDRLAITQLRGQARVSRALQAPLHAAFDAQGVVLRGKRIDKLTANIDGSLASHRLAASLRAGDDQLLATATGGVDALHSNAQWRGELSQLQASGRLALRSEAPAPLSASLRGFDLTRLRIASDFGRIVIDSLQRDDGRLASRGRIDALRVAALLPHVRQQAIASTDLSLVGDWDIALPADGKPAAGSLSVRRAQGDVVLASGERLALGLQKLQLDARAEGDRIALTLEAVGRQLGTIAFGGSVARRGPALLPDASSALDGVLSLELPSIAAVAGLASPSVLANGQLEGRMFVTGSIGDPVLNGTLQGRQLRLLLIDSGIELRDGQLDAVLSGDTLQLRELSFAGSQGQGKLALSGPLQLRDARASARLVWTLEKFRAFDRVDRKLQLSGNGQLRLADGRADLSGKIAVDSGFFDIGRSGAPELSDDVQVVGRKKNAQRTFALGMDVAVDLGERIRLRGRGLDARITGGLRFASAAGQPLSAQGEVQVVQGTYKAYGRELAIERGALRFDGEPGNPELDIRAMRRGAEVEAGVSIVGTAQSPRVSLVSEPQVPDAEKLSWLVLGQGLSNTSGAQLGMLQDAAGSLLTQGAAAGVQSQIASTLGLDAISVARSQDTLQQRIVTLGKRVSSRLYVSYQQGLEVASSVLLLRYTLSPRVTVEAETGTRSVFSLFYNFSFD